jgi:hypothetical protein
VLLIDQFCGVFESRDTPVISHLDLMSPYRLIECREIVVEDEAVLARGIKNYTATTKDFRSLTEYFGTPDHALQQMKAPRARPIPKHVPRITLSHLSLPLFTKSSVQGFSYLIDPL